jgi:hypothetical protein
MKTIIVLILLLLTAADLYIPQDSLLRSLAGLPQSDKCSIIYSEEEDGYTYEERDRTGCTFLEITSLPPLMEGDVPVKISFTKGSYSLKRSLSVGLDVGYKFILEDMLTGQMYDLKSETPYSFNVSRTIPDRFVMHVSKDSGKITHN